MAEYPNNGSYLDDATMGVLLITDSEIANTNVVIVCDEDVARCEVAVVKAEVSNGEGGIHKT